MLGSSDGRRSRGWRRSSRAVAGGSCRHLTVDLRQARALGRELLDGTAIECLGKEIPFRTRIDDLEQDGRSREVDDVDSALVPDPARVTVQDEAVAQDRTRLEFIRGSGRDHVTAGEHDETLTQ